MSNKLISTILICLALIGCKHNQSMQPLAATIKNTTPAIKADIQKAIVSLKGGVEPKLADNVLMNSSTLLLESRVAKQPLDPVLGTHNIAVERFELQLRNGLCVLYYPSKDNYVILPKVPCVAVTQSTH
ncbi:MULTISPECIES: hypothetical protein [Pseudoalteromonas]|uniref:Lipoprotein n=1 Tax=Pseudoalteromonas amylolytica TaxID=1859457 RepID=A0A1S1MM74_9GAMM|nr:MULTISPECIES: hypothetical protein [Pseudoalteromonas]MCF6437677.1 hypothetical protein [Pseudoalteromonas sp. MMG022]OHU85949.1 hypothetical protein BFC16_16925 [Pseudoalteromonas sp. JW3]OHU89440.1 hypothetical protein BET10_17650 [Pseudoalteromonas amylolytica]